jgi:hypothetical protein
MSNRQSSTFEQPPPPNQEDDMPLPPAPEHHRAPAPPVTAGVHNIPIEHVQVSGENAIPYADGVTATGVRIVTTNKVAYSQAHSVQQAGHQVHYASTITRSGVVAESPNNNNYPPSQEPCSYTIVPLPTPEHPHLYDSAAHQNAARRNDFFGDTSPTSGTVSSSGHGSKSNTLEKHQQRPVLVSSPPPAYQDEIGISVPTDPREATRVFVPHSAYKRLTKKITKKNANLCWTLVSWFRRIEGKESSDY